MHCHEARPLLDQGLSPSCAEAQQAILGFHLAGCPACRDYRAHIEHRQLLAALLASPPQGAREAARPISRPSQRRAGKRVLRASGAALALSGALALLPAAPPLPATAHAAPAPSNAALLVQRGAAAATHEARANRLASQSLLRARAHSDTALLAELLAQPVAQPQAVPEVAPQAVAEAPAAQGFLGNYVVQRGDTLSGIAAYFYGNGSLWGGIYDANRNVIGNPSLIYPGQVLAIPAYGTTNPQTGQGQTLNRYYTVVAGDTLSGIAVRFYTHGDWRAIYTANLGVIGSNPNLIYPGQVLYLP
jgi:LysM repeat protein